MKISNQKPVRQDGHEINDKEEEAQAREEGIAAQLGEIGTMEARDGAKVREDEAVAKCLHLQPMGLRRPQPVFPPSPSAINVPRPASPNAAESTAAAPAQMRPHRLRLHTPPAALPLYEYSNERY